MRNLVWDTAFSYEIKLKREQVHREEDVIYVFTIEYCAISLL